MGEPVVTKLDPRNPPVATASEQTLVDTDLPPEVLGVATESMGSGKMFDRIASGYDGANKFMSLGFDEYWRGKLVKECLHLESDDRVLDLATGTADVSIRAAAELKELNYDLPNESVIGVDPSQQMLRVGVEKVKELHLDGAVRLVKGDAQNLNSVQNITEEGLDDPTDGVASESIDKISMSFGIRNVPNRALAFQEMRRVIRKQERSRICILEFALPTGNTLLPAVARWFITVAIPYIGRSLSNDAAAEYKYLETSILRFPQPLDFAASMAKEGLGVESITSFAFGAVHLYQAVPVGS